MAPRLLRVGRLRPRPLAVLVLAGAALLGPTGVAAARPVARRAWDGGLRRPAEASPLDPEHHGAGVQADLRDHRRARRAALSTGTLFLPKGRAPRGGWPVISWAHGTSGLGDRCAPSVVGPALPQRDRPYLANWMRQGYAIVASDYAGLGTPGLCLPATAARRRTTSWTW